ncbi:MAG: cell division protein ZapE, partial [Gammaproteobacteria bacterium]
MSPNERFQEDLRQPGFRHDPAQAAVVAHTQRVYEGLLARPRQSPGVVGRFLRRVGKRQPSPVLGLYLWGRVGRGKTHLVNSFFDSLPFDRKLRRHFHRFMQVVHGELRTLRRTVDPLQTVAQRISDDARVVCLDEFHIADIADAMLLGRLLKALFARGVTVVATSNIPPQDLYKDGLPRLRCLPAIELSERHMEVVELAGPEDHRLRALEKAEIYHCPLDEGAQASLEECFRALAPENIRQGRPVEVEGRQIPTACYADGIAWFDFDDLCNGPRSTVDYIGISRYFHTVLLANVPRLGPTDEDAAARFIHLVDEFYDRNVNLIVSEEAVPLKKKNGRRKGEKNKSNNSRQKKKK